MAFFSGLSAFYWAMDNRSVKIAVRLLQLRPKFAMEDQAKFPPLMIASCHGLADVVRELLVVGRKLQQGFVLDKKGNTPLHEAADPEVARLLLEYGYNPLARNKEGDNPISVALHHKRRNVGHVLIEHVASYIDRKSAADAIMLPNKAEWNTVDHAIDALDARACDLLFDLLGDSISNHLDWARNSLESVQGSLADLRESLRHLLSYDQTKTSAKNSNSKLWQNTNSELLRTKQFHGTYGELDDIHWAVVDNDRDPERIKELLKDFPGHVNKPAGRPGYSGFTGYTPLHIAVDLAKPSVVKLLLKHGADPTIQVIPRGQASQIDATSYARVLISRCEEVIVVLKERFPSLSREIDSESRDDEKNNNNDDDGRGIADSIDDEGDLKCRNGSKSSAASHGHIGVYEDPAADGTLMYSARLNFTLCSAQVTIQVGRGSDPEHLAFLVDRTKLAMYGEQKIRTSSCIKLNGDLEDYVKEHWFELLKGPKGEGIGYRSGLLQNKHNLPKHNCKRKNDAIMACRKIGKDVVSFIELNHRSNASSSSSSSRSSSSAAAAAAAAGPAAAAAVHVHVHVDDAGDYAEQSKREMEMLSEDEEFPVDCKETGDGLKGIKQSKSGEWICTVKAGNPASVVEVARSTEASALAPIYDRVMLALRGWEYSRRHSRRPSTFGLNRPAAAETYKSEAWAVALREDPAADEVGYRDPDLQRDLQIEKDAFERIERAIKKTILFVKSLLPADEAAAVKWSVHTEDSDSEEEPEPPDGQHLLDVIRLATEEKMRMQLRAKFLEESNSGGVVKGEKKYEDSEFEAQVHDLPDASDHEVLRSRGPHAKLIGRSEVTDRSTLRIRDQDKLAYTRAIEDFIKCNHPRGSNTSLIKLVRITNRFDPAYDFVHGNSFGVAAKEDMLWDPQCPIVLCEYVGEYDLEYNSHLPVDVRFMRKSDMTLDVTERPGWPGSDGDNKNLLINANMKFNEAACINDVKGRRNKRFANVGFIEVTVDGWPRIFVILVRSVKAGEQLLAKYGESYWRGMQQTTKDFVFVADVAEVSRRQAEEEARRAKEGERAALREVRRLQARLEQVERASAGRSNTAMDVDDAFTYFEPGPPEAGPGPGPSHPASAAAAAAAATSREPNPAAPAPAPVAHPPPRAQSAVPSQASPAAASADLLLGPIRMGISCRAKNAGFDGKPAAPSSSPKAASLQSAPAPSAQPAAADSKGKAPVRALHASAQQPQQHVALRASPPSASESEAAERALSPDMPAASTPTTVQAVGQAAASVAASGFQPIFQEGAKGGEAAASSAPSASSTSRQQHRPLLAPRATVGGASAFGSGHAKAARPAPPAAEPQGKKPKTMIDKRPVSESAGARASPTPPARPSNCGRSPSPAGLSASASSSEAASSKAPASGQKPVPEVIDLDEYELIDELPPKAPPKAPVCIELDPDD
eukprot:tig00001187_g7464.t1